MIQSDPTQFRGLGQAGEAAAVATTSSALGVSPYRSVGLGVLTGVLVWLTTRALTPKPQKAICRCNVRRRRSRR